jgi:hypothetical protein
MILHIQTNDELAIANDSAGNFHNSNSIENITPFGDIPMTLIINRLAELSDALQNVELYPEAQVVQSHINRLSSNEYSEKLSNHEYDTVLSELLNDFR